MSSTRRPRLFVPLACTLGLFLLALPIQAEPEPGRWTPFGPGGGTPGGLAVDPRDPSVVYAAAHALYRSHDGGETWTALFGLGLRSVAIDPVDPSRIYAGGDRLVRSTDGGRTWETTYSRTPLDVTSLAVVPGRPSVVFAVHATGVLRSADGGGTWSPVLADRPVREIAVAPASPRTVYAASYGEVFKSTDAGKNWSLVAAPVSDDRELILGIVAAPSSSGTLYALVLPLLGGQDLFRSDDGARSWRRVGRVPESTTHVLVDSRSPSRLYAGGFGIFVSEDGGMTWRRILQGLPQPPYGESLRITALAADPSRPGILYAGIEERGIAKSTNSGYGWRIGVETGLSQAFVRTFKFHPLRPDTIYLGLTGSGSRAFRSTDGGRTWKSFARRINRDGLYDLAFDPTDPDLLYTTGGSGQWQSRDGGETWERIGNSFAYKIAALGSQTLLTGEHEVRRTTDGGRTWNTVIPPLLSNGDLLLMGDLRVDPEDSRHVYALMYTTNDDSKAYSYLFRSDDSGAAWKRLGVHPSLLAVAPSDFRTLYAADTRTGRILRSLDAGESWTPIRQTPPLMTDLTVDASDPATVYIGSRRDGVLRSRDGGVTLEPLGVPLEISKQVGRLFSHPQRPGLLYTDSFDGGLFEIRFE